VGQQHEREAVAVVGAVGDRGLAGVPIEHPGEAALRPGVGRVHERERVARDLAPRRVAQVARTHRVREHVARAADEVARARVVHAAVVLEELVEAAAGVDAAALVERHRVGDVGAQERGGPEVGQRRGGSMATIIGGTPATRANTQMPRPVRTPPHVADPARRVNRYRVNCASFRAFIDGAQPAARR
jgi:phage terminase small subunit